VDITTLVSSWQGLDQAVAPAHRLRGGSSAGYARWEGFKTSGGLALYAAQRNNALNRSGVSRLSPYHRHGMVSPFKVAREASAANAVKFLDEFLTWREISYHYCWHR
jgi:deoxyribodipyrimidine photolyase